MNSYYASADFPRISALLRGQLGPLSNFISPLQLELDLHEELRETWKVNRNGCMKEIILFILSARLGCINKLLCLLKGKSTINVDILDAG